MKIIIVLILRWLIFSVINFQLKLIPFMQKLIYLDLFFGRKHLKVIKKEVYQITQLPLFQELIFCHRK